MILNLADDLILNALKQFKSISLDTLGKADLQDRVDTKFVLHQSNLPLLLNRFQAHGSLLYVTDRPFQHYKNLYFDDLHLNLYLQHHDRKGNRCKVRFREYTDTKTVFFEVKQKINKNRTIKERIQEEGIAETLSIKAIELVQLHSSHPSESLRPTLWLEFDRITMVSFSGQERMTLDFNIKTRNGNNAKAFDGLVVAEVKQAGRTHSLFNHIMKENSIRPLSLSKYCLAITQLHPTIKQNNFKPKLLAIKKMLDKYGN